MNNKISKEMKEFIDSIDSNTPEEIILQAGKKELENPMQGLMTKIQLMRVLEGATLTDVCSTKEGLLMIFLKDGKVYQLDWMDGYGVTLSEYKRPGEWSFQD